ncbi:hypothetical protein GX50_03623 [[Emmonsia] crescens]|uniref:Uncharacterized protein n=1 Tax=[Emmonsia] crescens TaxID=73230 RepID=A0A2B7ZJM2_9EURO|nr:hypothetical protein GX50_03623 [Emmonsia crescens]
MDVSPNVVRSTDVLREEKRSTLNMRFPAPSSSSSSIIRQSCTQAPLLARQRWTQKMAQCQAIEEQTLSLYLRKQYYPLDNAETSPVLNEVKFASTPEDIRPQGSPWAGLLLGLHRTF